MADLLNQPLKTLLGLLDRVVSGLPGQSGADNILYPDLREQIGDEIIESAPEKLTLVDADEVGISDSEDSNLLKGVSLANVEVYTRAKGGNIIANKGVGLDAAKPVVGLIAGEIFVSNDTFKKYTALTATTWDVGTALINAQIITDSSTDTNDRFQYDGTDLLVWSGKIDEIITPFFNNTLVDADPGANHFSGNTNDVATWARINLSTIQNNIDVSSFMAQFVAGTKVILLQRTDPTKFINITLNADVTIATGFVYSDDFTIDDSGVLFDDEELCLTNFTVAVSGGSGGGHDIQEQQDETTPVGLPTQGKLLFRFANGVTSLFNNLVNLSTDVILTIRGMNDYDATGETAGSIIQRNGANDGFDVVLVALDERFKSAMPEANISVDGALSIPVYAANRLLSIRVLEQSGNSAGNISIGTTALGNDIVNAEPVGANADFEFTLLKKYFHSTNDTTIYISSSAWGTGVLSVYNSQNEI